MLDFAGIVFDGADLINALVYVAEKDYVNAAISLVCGIPAVVAVVAKGIKAVKAIKAVAKITYACKTVAKVGNVVVGVKASYDTYTEDKQKGYSTGAALAHMEGTAVAGYVTRKSASWAAKKVTNFAGTNLPKLASSVKEKAGRFVNKVKNAFQSGGLSEGAGKAENGGGWICVNQKECIYLWLHDAPEDSYLYLIKKSFRNFISIIEISEMGVRASNSEGGELSEKLWKMILPYL